MWTSDRDETLSTERLIEEYPALAPLVHYVPLRGTLTTKDGREWKRVYPG